MGPTRDAPAPLCFLHIGDLHITDAGLANHVDLQRIVDEANTNLSHRAAFAFLPGDIADDGTPAQFALVAKELSRLTLPWHAITGDHDFKPRSLANFYDLLHARRLPYADNIAGVRCIFLDIVSAGTGGPDFRLGGEQTAWLTRELADLRASGRRGIIFMHSYPADQRADGAKIGALIDQSNVVLVDMGHTHYNELSHDGRTIYAATRSTGQSEEGDVGYSLIAVDGDVVSWRFKALGSDWPFAMITAPADYRLAFADGSASRCHVRAVAFGKAAANQASFQIEDSHWQQMVQLGEGLFASAEPLPPLDGRRTIRVRITDQDGLTATDTITQDSAAIARASTGSDAGAIGAWADRHIHGTQLGPNRNGRKW